MSEKKRPEKISPLPELQSTVTEILVANGRSFQPFIRTFHYTGENVSKSNLGALIGVFEIDELSEDCAYIVNFLASVAKKEYFNNPRRGAIESFEAALHKINLALSELVKHGNVTWLGKLHGTLAVLEKNNFHFSVTGQAKILLLRNGSLSDISDGLASEESQLHPIKTFVEVSSGRLSLDDRILLTSPELLALFSLDELTKNARRMDHGQFLQFLKTALINELDMAGLLLVEVDEEITAPAPRTTRKTEEKSMERVQNIFSQAAFLPKHPGAAPVPQERVVLSEPEADTKEEYTDTKTGHIYVQGDSTEEPGQHIALERLKLQLEEVAHGTRAFFMAQGKWLRKGKKQLLITVSVLGEESQALSKKIGRATRRLWRRQQASLKSRFAKKAHEETLLEKTTPAAPITTPVPPSLSLPSETTTLPTPEPLTVTAEPEAAPLLSPGEQPTEHTDELPPFMKEKLAFFYQKQTAPLPTQAPPRQTVPTPQSESLARAMEQVKTYSHWARTFLKGLPFRGKRSAISTGALRPLIHRLRSYQNNISLPQQRLIFGGLGLLFCLVLLGFFFLKSRTMPVAPPAETSQPEVLTDTTVPSNTGTVLDEASVALDGISEPIVASVVLNNEPYLITEKTILTTSKASFPLPQGRTARFATAMDDLRLIFVYTENGTLYAWSPISKTFVENALALPGGATVTGIDTYLTYLYVLDSGNDQVYRFPRAEGGFGTGTPWLKETLPLETTARITVNESLFITLDPSTVKSFFRGRHTNTFAVPENGFIITDLYTHPGLTNVYALDSEHQRIIVWNQDGRLIKELSHQTLQSGHTLSVNEKTGELFVSTDHSLLSFKLK